MKFVWGLGLYAIQIRTSSLTLEHLEQAAWTQ